MENVAAVDQLNEVGEDFVLQRSRHHLSLPPKKVPPHFLKAVPFPLGPSFIFCCKVENIVTWNLVWVISILEHWPAQEREERVGERALPASVELAPLLPLPTSPQQYSECPQLMRKPVVQVQVGVDGVSFLTMQCSPILNDAVFQRKTLSSMFNSDIKKPTTSCLR